jgi:multicomponent Na+:H+ antiporter subunit E
LIIVENNLSKRKVVTVEKQSILHDESIVGSPVVHLVGMAVVLFAFWMILSGHTEIKFIVYGVLTSVVTAWVTYPLLLVTNKDGNRKYFVFGISLPKLLKYSLWLLWQLVLANIDVARATTSQNLNINPKVVRFYFRTDNPMAEVVLADSITLTPGTVTLNVTDDGLFEIHALTDGAAAGVLDGSMQRKVADLFGEKLDFAVAEGED